MNARWFVSWCLLGAVFTACGGRAEVLGSGDQAAGCAATCQPSMGGSTSHGGTGGVSAEPNTEGGTVSEMAGVGGVEAGAGGEIADGGMSPLGGGGTGNAGSTGDLGGTFNTGGVSGTCAPGAGPFASEVLGYSFGGGQDFNQSSGFPDAIFGPPVANDPSSVVSLGNGGWVVLGFSGNGIVDGPGADFTVFENPLPTFKELATVAVSEDAEHWVEFPCTAAQNASDFGFCAGVGVVYSSPKNGIDPRDPTVSGGDHYDLADIGVGRARFVRITDRVDLVGSAGVFDLDAVAIVHSECD